MGFGDAICEAAGTICLVIGGHHPLQLLIWVGLVGRTFFFYDTEAGDIALMSTLRMMRKSCGALARLAKENGDIFVLYCTCLVTQDIYGVNHHPCAALFLSFLFSFTKSK